MYQNVQKMKTTVFTQGINFAQLCKTDYKKQSIL